YTLCGGWGMLDDCEERREACVADPRREGECGPACDGPGICHPRREVCGGEDGGGCPEGMECFLETDQAGGRGSTGMCFPLRYGSDYYERSREGEVVGGIRMGFRCRRGRRQGGFICSCSTFIKL
ncbi:hypothetical protein B0T18DRAFT_320502, partial [Schizothecium vesticola]